MGGNGEVDSLTVDVIKIESTYLEDIFRQKLDFSQMQIITVNI